MNNPGLNITVRENGKARLFETLALFELSPGLTRRYLQRMARFTKHVSAKNCAENRTVDGSPMKPRQLQQTAKGEKKKRGYKLNWKRVRGTKNSYEKEWDKIPDRVLQRMMKSRSFAIWIDPFSATLSWKNPMTGNIALRQQQGGSETVTYKTYPNDNSYLQRQGVPSGLKERGRPRLNSNGEKMCTHTDAVMLLKLGVTRYGHELTYRQIREEATRKQAAAMIMKHRHRILTKTTTVKTPARPFLGLNPIQREICAEAIMGSLSERVMKNKAYKQTLETL